MSRNSRRAVLKDICRVYAAQGYLPNSPPTAFGLVRELDDILRQKTDAARAAKAAGRALAVYDAALQKHGYKGALGCKKGCNYCCHTSVSATAPEIFHMARSLRKTWSNDEEFKTRFESSEAATRSLTLDQRFERKLPCPLLVDGACFSYQARPLSCRAHVSLSQQACLDAFNDVADDIPHPKVNQEARSVLLAALKAALDMNGLETNAYELGHALHIALSDSTSEARWLAGEQVFQHVAHAAPKPDASGSAELMKNVLIAGARGSEMPPNPIFQWPA